jgi:hypothetical protein
VNRRDWQTSSASSDIRQHVERVVSQLVALSRSEEACRLLGVDGVLADQADITLLDDPLDYAAYDIAAAVRDAAEEVAPVQASMLSTLVAELRMCSLLLAHLDQHDLTERVVRHVRDLQGGNDR